MDPRQTILSREAWSLRYQSKVSAKYRLIPFRWSPVVRLAARRVVTGRIAHRQRTRRVLPGCD